MGAALEIGVTQIGSRFGSSAGFNCSVLRQLWLPPAVFKHCRNDFFFLSKEKLFPYSVAGGAGSGTNVTIPLPPARARCLQPGLAASHPQKGKSKGLLGKLRTSHTFPQVFLDFCVPGTAAGVGSPWSRGCRAQPPELCQPFPGKALLAPKALPCSPPLPCGQPRGAGVPTAGETEARSGSVLGMGQSSFLEKQ